MNVPSRLGPFEIGRKLGQGGMGAVYLARHAGLDRPVALKVLLDDGSDPEIHARFAAEAKNVARLRHPGIVSIFDVGEADGRRFIAMEYIEGEPLDRLIAAKRPPVRWSLGIARDVARAIAHAHDAGVVHRDLKPANVLVRQVADGSSEPIVVDFGLALGGSTSRLTRVGDVLGTPAYMSPEQAGGEPDEVGPPTDVYAIGATLYECLTGRPPFSGERPIQVLHDVLLREPRPPRELDPRIHADAETIVKKAMEKEPERRYRSAAALADDLGRFLDGEAIDARPPSAGRRLRRWTRRRLAILVPTAVLLVAAMAWVGHAATRPGRLEVVVQSEDAVDVRIEVDGQQISGTSISLTAGVHQVDVTAEGHEATSAAVTIRRAETAVLAVDLHPTTGWLRIHASPRGTRVVIDGISYGTPLHQRFPIGHYEGWAELPGHHVGPVIVDVSAGDSADRPPIEIALPQAQGWARSYVDWDRTVVVGDVDGDGVDDIATIRYASSLLLLSGSTGGELANLAIGEDRDRDVAWVDLDADGVSELIANELGQTVIHDLRAISRGDAVPRVIGPGRRAAQAPILLIDTDGDERDDHFVSAASGLVALRKSAATPSWRAATPGRVVYTDLGPDVDGDGCPDVLAVGDTWAVLVSARSGASLWRATIRSGEVVFRAASTGELVVLHDDGLTWIDPSTGATREVAVPGLPRGGRWTGSGSAAAAGPTLDRTHGDWPLHLSAGTMTLLGLADGGRLIPFELDGAPEVVRVLDVGDGQAPVLTVFDRMNQRLDAWTELTDGWGRAWAIAGSRTLRLPADLLVDGRTVTVGVDDRLDRIDLVTGETLASHQLPADVAAAPIRFDYDQDGSDDLAVGTVDGQVMVLGASGSVLFRASLRERIARSFALIEANGDGLPDLLVDAFGPTVVYAADPVQPRWRIEAGDAVRAGPVCFGGDAVRIVLPLRDHEQSDLAILDGSTGASLHRVRIEQDMIRPPTLVRVGGEGRRLALWTTRGEIALVDPRDGSVERRIPAQESGKHGYADIAAGDLDGDGRDELVAATWFAGSRRVFALGGPGWDERWSVAVQGGSWRAPTIAAIDGAPPDVFVATRAGEVLRLDGGSGAPVWSRSTGVESGTGVVIVEGEPPLAVIGCADGGLRAFDARRGTPTFQVAGAGSASATPAVIETAEGEVVIASPTAAGVVGVSPRGELRWHAAKGDAFLAPPLAVDLDGDGVKELVVGSSRGKLHVIGAEGSVLLTHWLGSDAGVEGRPAAADIDGDGSPEVIVGTLDGQVIALDGFVERLARERARRR